jgi:hypothetical protein
MAVQAGCEIASLERRQVNRLDAQKVGDVGQVLAALESRRPQLLADLLRAQPRGLGPARLRTHNPDRHVPASIRSAAYARRGNRPGHSID